jgi:hypothetical protein
MDPFCDESQRDLYRCLSLERAGESEEKQYVDKGEPSNE